MAEMLISGLVAVTDRFPEDISSLYPHPEIKAELIFARSAAAHRNYVGDSIIGQDVNLEAGAVLANHFNERTDKRDFVRVDGPRSIPG